MRELITQLTRSPATQIQQARQRLRNASGNVQARIRHADSLIQAGQTPYQQIYQQGIMRLRYYPPLQESQIEIDGQTIEVAKHSHPIPLVIVAPLATNMLIYDLFPHRSLVRFLRAKGFELYMVDWGDPLPEHNHYSLASYITDFLPAMLQQVRKHSGQQKLSLHGWSFGGLFSLCYTALGTDPDIANLVLVGAPCDYHSNGDLGKQYQRLSKQLGWLENKTGWTIHRAPKALLRTPGWANSLGFKLTNPVGTLQGYMALLRNLHDREYVSNHMTNAAFLDQMVAYPGGVIQDIVQFLLHENRVAQGKMPFANSTGNLSNVNASILSIAGQQDPIVTQENTQRILELVNSTDTQLEVIEGGHMGIVSGSKAPAQSWHQISDWLESRSGEPHDQP